MGAHLGRGDIKRLLRGGEGPAGVEAVKSMHAYVKNHDALGEALQTLHDRGIPTDGSVEARSAETKALDQDRREDLEVDDLVDYARGVAISEVVFHNPALAIAFTDDDIEDEIDEIDDREYVDWAVENIGLLRRDNGALLERAERSLANAPSLSEFSFDEFAEQIGRFDKLITQQLEATGPDLN